MFFLLSLWVFFGFIVFLSVHGFLFGLRLCLCSGFVLILCSFGFGYKVISDGQGEVCFAQRAREELWREHPCLTTTTNQLGRGLRYGVCTDIQE